LRVLGDETAGKTWKGSIFPHMRSKEEATGLQASRGCPNLGRLPQILQIPKTASSNIAV